MQIQAKRTFLSTSYGNIAVGSIINVSDMHGKIFIQHGLAEEVKPLPASANLAQKGSEKESAPGFTKPGVEKETPGLSSPADQASPKTTANGSESGAPKKASKASRKKSAKSPS